MKPRLPIPPPSPMVEAEGTKIFHFDNPRLLEKALLGKELHRGFYLLKRTKSTKTTSQKCWRIITWAIFFGRPYRTNGIKTRLGLPLPGQFECAEFNNDIHFFCFWPEISTSQLNRSKYRVYAKGPALWNEFLADSEKEIENLSLFKSKVKFKLLSYENEIIFF